MSDNRFMQTLTYDTSSIQKSHITRHDKTEIGKMKLFKFTLTVMTFAGCWRPNSWASLYKCILYYVYTALLIFLLYTFGISQFMEIILNAGSPEEFTGILYMFLAVCVSSYKIFNMCISRSNVAYIIHVLTDGPFKPMVTDEIKIRQKFDKFMWQFSFCCWLLVVLTAVSIGLSSVSMNYGKGILIYKAWLPFNYSSSVLFPLTFAHQWLGMFICGMINFSYDVFLCSLLLHVCCQIEILEYRLKNRSYNQKTLRDCVHHHDLIFDFASFVNEKFAKGIAFQFITSTVLICSNLYQLSQSTINAEYISLVLYTSCGFLEIFVFCWFGNEVKLKSLQLTDRIYEMDWPLLNNSFKKNLLIIMNRAMIPIEFTSAYLISMNVESFVGLLRLSYSAYTLLKRV